MSVLSGSFTGRPTNKQNQTVASLERAATSKREGLNVQGLELPVSLGFVGYTVHGLGVRDAIIEPDFSSHERGSKKQETTFGLKRFL